MAKNTICHVDWNSTDFERTSRFFSGLFGWTFRPQGDDYLLFSVEGGIGGGFLKAQTVTPVNEPSIYIEVEAIEPYLEKASGLGGGVAVGKTDIDGIGWFAFPT